MKSPSPERSGGSGSSRQGKGRRLTWVYSQPILNTLDAATWLETTDSLRRMGWDVTLIAPGPGGRCRVSGVEVLCLSRPDLYLCRQLIFHGKVLAHLLRHWSEVNVLLFHPMSAPYLLPLLFLRPLKGSKTPLLVIDTRTVQMEPRERATLKFRLRRVFFKISRRMTNRLADGQTAITKRMAEAVRIPDGHLWGVWPSGVDPALFSRGAAARKWPRADEPITLVYIGSMNHERNLMTFCRAVGRANGEGGRLHARLVGDGTGRKDLEEFAAASGGSIEVLPPVPHSKVGDVLRTAHVGVLPFPDEEKFRVSSPIKLFEYMASGLPVLATRIICHTDVMEEGTYSFWAEKADAEGLLEALRQVGQSRDRLSMMGRAAAAASKTWTWEESARKLSAALEKGLAAG